MLDYGILLLYILYKLFKKILFINKAFFIIKKIQEIKLDLKTILKSFKKEKTRYKDKYLKKNG